MNIIVDIDGCVCAYDFAALIKKHFGAAVSNEDIYAYAIEDVLGVSALEVGRMFKAEVFAEPNFIKGAKEALHKLHEEGHFIFIHTNRVHFMRDSDLIEWMQLYGIPFDCLYKEQGRIFDYQIDDCPSKLMSVPYVAHRLLFTQPWNVKCKNITGKLERVKNWQEVLRRIHDGEKSVNIRSDRYPPTALRPAYG